MRPKKEPKKPRLQCAKCPWKVTTDPNEIPDGYSATMHEKLRGTIAVPGALPNPNRPLRVFACHETKAGNELACVGWLVHQMGVGNNIDLRIAVSIGRIDANVETVGEQHQRFEDTLPKEKSDGDVHEGGERSDGVRAGEASHGPDEGREDR